METDVLRVEALRNNHRWFTELQPAHDRAQPWIKILCLEAGKFGEPLCGTLKIEELDATEPFDALSYSCGPPVLGRTITVNNTPGFRITQNLWNALQRVRRKDEGRRLWVDAICIDQEDEREKSSQIRHMHAVYSRAEEVCVYFGENAERRGLKGVFEPVYVILWPGITGCRNLRAAQKLQKLVDALNDLGGFDYAGKNKIIGQYLDDCDAYWIDLTEFVKQAEDSLRGDLADDSSSLHFWWKRLWTVQELLLAKRPVVYYGRYVMPWNTICQIWIREYALFRKGFYKLGLIRGKAEPWNSKGPQRAVSKLYRDITYLDNLRNQRERNLHALLLATINKAFTEPKDRIFALLGALPRRTLSLDYSMDERVNNALAAMHCIVTQGTFDILFSRWRRSYQLNPQFSGLHSCVPDFSQSHGTSDLSWRTPCISRPEQGRWESARVSTVPDMLRDDRDGLERNHGISTLTKRAVRINMIENTKSRCRIVFGGACVATVNKLYRLGQHNLDWILADLSKTTSRYIARPSRDESGHCDKLTCSKQEQCAYDVYTLLLESCSLHHGGDVAKPMDLNTEAENQRQSLWAMKTNHVPKECPEFLAIADECPRRPWNDCLAGPLASRRSDWTASGLLDFPEQLEEVHEILRAILCAVSKDKTWSGTFFITSDGHLGIGPELTQPGDRIVVLDGARSPFVLKPLENSSDYAFLGDSFVLGLMHGEVREMDARGQLESREFVIR